MPPSHLVLTLSREGWGEAAVGLILAEQLRSRGEDVFFVTHANNAPLLRETSFEHATIEDARVDHTYLEIRECVRNRRVSSIVLCDSVASDELLRRSGVEGTALLRLGVPIIGVDTWDHGGHSEGMDVFGSHVARPGEWIANIPSLLPCPILRPDDRSGVCRVLAPGVVLADAERRTVREDLGLTARHKAVLFCTANWQQRAHGNAAKQRCATSFADLLARYASNLHRDVCVVHVGPAPLEPFEVMSDRYRWLSPRGKTFDRLLGAIDLVVSANISATTVGRAVASDVPVLMLRNSCGARTVDEAIAWLGARATPTVVEWLPAALPMFAFSVWPIGLHRFTARLLRDNPYGTAVEHVEWLDATRVVDEMNALLFDPAEQQRLRERQREYQRRLQRLPTCAEAFDALQARGRQQVFDAVRGDRGSEESFT